jgi:hypothetical protein
MTSRVIILDHWQRERMVAILGSILDNEHDKRKMGDDFQLTDDQLVNIEVRCNWLSGPARNGNVEMIVEDWLSGMIVDYGEDYPDIVALVAPFDVVREALSRALERYELMGADEEVEEWLETGDPIADFPLAHEYQLVHNALKALNNTTALIADLKEA